MSTPRRTDLQELVLDIVAENEIDVEAQTISVSYQNLTRLIKLSGLGDIENVNAILDSPVGGKL